MEVKFGTGRSNLTGPVVDGLCIRQTFKALLPELKYVEIAFATYCRENAGEMTIAIHDTVDNALIGKTKTFVAGFTDNSTEKFDLNVELVPGRTYELRMFTLNCRNGSSVTAKYCRKNFPNSHLFIGARLIKDGELSLSFTYEGEIQRPQVEHQSPQQIDMDAVLEPPRDENSLAGLVSVVIPHLNCYELLQRCLSSLCMQTYNALEVIVVDDGSKEPGRTQLITESFGKMLSTKFLCHAKNEGAPAARNIGARYASGEYILFLDADCMVYPDAIQVYVETLMKNQDASWSYGGFRWGHEQVVPVQWNEERLFSRNYISTMSMIRRAEFPKDGWDEKLKRHQDWDLWLTMVKAGHKGVCTGQYMFETPRREGSISTDGNIDMMKSVKIIRRKHGL